MADEALESARDRRRQMFTAMVDVELAVQAPARASNWASKLLTELADLSTAVEAHIATVEGPGGIIERVVTDAPRLDGHGKRLRDDHVVIRDLLARSNQLLESVSSPPAEDEVEEIRTTVLDLITALSRHRQRGSDFVWEGYDVDIGGPG